MLIWDVSVELHEVGHFLFYHDDAVAAKNTLTRQLTHRFTIDSDPIYKILFHQ